MLDNLKKTINSLFQRFNSGKTNDAFKEIEKLVQGNNTNIDLIIAYGIMANKLNYESKAIKSFTYV